MCIEEGRQCVNSGKVTEKNTKTNRFKNSENDNKKIQRVRKQNCRYNYLTS